jgi:hypothetical protein
VTGAHLQVLGRHLDAHRVAHGHQARHLAVRYCPSASTVLHGGEPSGWSWGPPRCPSSERGWVTPGDTSTPRRPLQDALQRTRLDDTPLHPRTVGSDWWWLVLAGLAALSRVTRPCETAFRTGKDGVSCGDFVGEAGFEPATTSTQSSCTTGLCDSPMTPRLVAPHAAPVPQGKGAPTTFSHLHASIERHSPTKLRHAATQVRRLVTRKRHLQAFVPLWPSQV